MSTTYCVYKKETGEITSVLSLCESPIHANYEAETEAYIETDGHVDDSTHYIKDGKLVERPDMELKVSKNEIKADGEDSVTISNIPTGCEVFCPKLPGDQQLFTVDDGEITFQTELKGSYIFQFSLFPYKECEVVINAN